jgi:hypothetical protein
MELWRSCTHRIGGCTPPEELYARAVSIKPEIIDSFPVRFLAVQALEGARLNGHRDIIKELREEKRQAKSAPIWKLRGQRLMTSCPAAASSLHRCLTNWKQERH